MATDEQTAVGIELTAGQIHDATAFSAVIEHLPADHKIRSVVMDKGYDSDAIRAELTDRKMNPVIPGRENRTQEIKYDKKLYRQRNKVERLISKLKQFRRIATRYEKLKETFLAMIHLTAAFLIVR